MNRTKAAREDLAALLILLVVALVLYAPVLAPGRVLLPADLLLITPPWAQESRQLSPDFTHVLRRTWDPLFQFYPARKFLADSLHQGWIPLWNPHSFSGTPFAADGQSAVFYPVNWLFALLPLPFAFGAVAFLHTLCTGVFFYLYGRRVGYTAAGCTGGAIVWMLCGVQVGWQMWQVVDSTLCWLPLCLYFWEGVRTSTNFRQGVGLSLSIAMTLLAGHLQFAFYVLLTTATYALCRPLATGALGYAKTMQNLCAWLVLGISIAATQLFATLDLLHLSIRTSAPITALLPSALSPAQIGLLVMPEIFGGERDYLNHSFLAGEYYEKVIYCGAAAVVFAAFALRLRRPGDLSRYWLGLSVFALLMGLGTPLYNAFYYVVPLYKSFHGLSRIFVLLDFSVAALAAQGITLLESEAALDRKKTAQIVGAVVCLSILVFYRIGILENGAMISYLLTHDWFAYGLAQMGTALGFAAAGVVVLLAVPQRAAWVAVALVGLDMLLFACGLNPGSSSDLLYPSTPDTAFVSGQLSQSPLDRVLCISDGDPNRPQSRITPNGAMSLGWNDVSGSDPLILSRYNAFVSHVNSVDTGQIDPAGQGMIAEAGDPALDKMNVRWIVGRRELDIPSYRLAYSGAVNVYENLNAKGPAWLLPSVAGEARGGEIQSVTSVGPGQVTVRATTNDPAILVLSQTYCPGLVGFVDGRPEKIQIVDGLLPGVALTPGKHSVAFYFRPPAIRFGLYVTCIAWLVACCLFFQRGRNDSIMAGC